METEDLTLQSAMPFCQVPNTAMHDPNVFGHVFTAFVFTLGNDEGHFRLDGETGEMRVIRAVKDRLTTTTLHLKVMVRLMSSMPVEGLRRVSLTAFHVLSCNQAYQKDDPRKYSVATVLVHVLAVNQFPPEFDMTEYCGFVTAGKSLASLVNTYGNKALMLHVQDRDFNHVRVLIWEAGSHKASLFWTRHYYP